MLEKHRRIMVAEDEPLIAIMLEEMLRELGWEVSGTAYTEPEAMAQLDICQPSLAILDINLGGNTSLDVAAKCVERGIPIVFTTGYTAQDLPPECVGSPILAKPYSMAELEACLERAGSGIRADGRIVETAHY